MKRTANIRVLVILLAIAAAVAVLGAQGTSFLSKVYLGTGACLLSTGSGTPEGAVTGSVCDLYLRTNGGASTTLYVKESGSGNTGWAAMGASSGGTVTPSSSDTFTNKTLDTEGTGNTVTVPFVLNFVLGICQDTTATSGLSLPSSNPAVAACVSGTNTKLAVMQFADSANLSMQGHFTLPADFTGNIDVRGKWRTSATSGDVVWQAQLTCPGDGDTIDPSFNSASTTTETAKGTTLQSNDFAITSVTATGCAAGDEAFLKFFRDSANGSDTLAATADLISLTVTVRRAL